MENKIVIVHEKVNGYVLFLVILLVSIFSVYTGSHLIDFILNMLQIGVI